MDSEVWASIITTLVVPILLKVLVHYFPWLADAVTPEKPAATVPGATSPDPVLPSNTDQAASLPPSEPDTPTREE